MVRRASERCCTKFLNVNEAAGSHIDAAYDSPSIGGQAGTKKRKKRGQTARHSKSGPRKVKAEKDSELLTCDQERWNWFLSSGHWQLPGEAQHSTWKDCKVSLVQDGQMEQLIALQLAAQPMTSSQHTAAPNASPRPFGAMPKTSMMANRDELVPHQCSYNQSSTAECAVLASSTKAPEADALLWPYVADSPCGQSVDELDLAHYVPGAMSEPAVEELDLGPYMPHALHEPHPLEPFVPADSDLSLPPSSSHSADLMLAFSLGHDEEDDITALLQSPQHG
eukprot:jgi/Ulvmu1/2035/UM120_0031.1